MTFSSNRYVMRLNNIRVRKLLTIFYKIKTIIHTLDIFITSHKLLILAKLLSIYYHYTHSVFGKTQRFKLIRVLFSSRR